jgi:uncharacterized membrane protein YcaP (DUF421 family)
MWFDTWKDIVRVLLVTAAGYATLVVILRASGKRTLAKLNAFDLIVTVALGSTLATILLNSTVTWSEGAVALAGLAGLQFMVAITTVRFPRVRGKVTSQPSLLLRDGEYIEDEMRRQRVAHSEIRQAIRATGVGDLGKVAAVVLESDGTLSVIQSQQAGDRSALLDARPSQ